MSRAIGFVYDDGGRAAAGFKGAAGDCCARAIAIAAQVPYADAYALVNEVAQSDRRGKRKRGSGISNARTGVYKATMQRVMARLGWKWTPTMHIGSGCKVHLRADELPGGRIICNVSKHYVAVIDGVIHDTHNPSERGTTIYPPHTKLEDLPKGAYRLTYPNGDPHPNGWAYKPERCVYGYWSAPEARAGATPTAVGELTPAVQTDAAEGRSETDSAVQGGNTNGR